MCNILTIPSGECLCGVKRRLWDGYELILDCHSANNHKLNCECVKLKNVTRNKNKCFQKNYLTV